jgi:hypothetical protein
MPLLHTKTKMTTMSNTGTTHFMKLREWENDLPVSEC